jgi:riboflavin synthase
MSMFTGIVSAVGVVIETGSSRIGINHSATARRLKRGSSVAVNGCCLTVVKKSGPAFFADVVPETLRRTNLGALNIGSRVNLELPIAANGLLDGHLVQGHVDAHATVKRVKQVAAGQEVEIGMPKDLGRFVAEKGSIAVDGVSLTVAGVDDARGMFSVALIPHTLAATIAHEYKPGSIVNLEIDVVARYVARNLRR